LVRTLQVRQFCLEEKSYSNPSKRVTNPNAHGSASTAKAREKVRPHSGRETGLGQGRERPLSPPDITKRLSAPLLCLEEKKVIRT